MLFLILYDINTAAVVDAHITHGFSLNNDAMYIHVIQF